MIKNLADSTSPNQLVFMVDMSALLRPTHPLGWGTGEKSNHPYINKMHTWWFPVSASFGTARNNLSMKGSQT
jgi:hypothetical protein